MNREQRRAARKAGMIENTEPVYTMKGSDIKHIREQENKRAADSAIVLMLALPIKVLYDQFGFSIEELMKVADALVEEYEEFKNGSATLNDYAEFVYELTGIKFERSK